MTTVPMSSSTTKFNNTLASNNGTNHIDSHRVDQKVGANKNVTANTLNGPKTIEIAGYTILAMPLESMGLTVEQQEKFKIEAKGFEIDCSIMTREEQIQFALDNTEAPIDWQVSFETLQAEIDGIPYRGFDLFKKIYEAFPDILSMTKDDAIEAGLYPIIHYRNHAARKWMAEMHGGHLATLDKSYIGEVQGELVDIYSATLGENNIKKLAAIGQAPLGGRYNDGQISGLGNWSILSSCTPNERVRVFGEDTILGINIHRDKAGIYNGWVQKFTASSSVIVFE